MNSGFVTMSIYCWLAGLQVCVNTHPGMHVFVGLYVCLCWFHDKEKVVFDCLPVLMLNKSLTKASSSKTASDSETL